MNKKTNILNTISWLSLIVLITILFLFAFSGYEYSKKLNNICLNYYNQGYESYQDIATHKDCRLNYNTNFGTKNFYDVYNDTCRLEKEYLDDYGINCVWGSIGYFKLVMVVGICAVIISLIVIVTGIIIGNGSFISQGVEL